MDGSTASWPRLSGEIIDALSAPEQEFVRQHEEELIAGNKLAVDDIIYNCHMKPQFAKTYRVLRRDKRQLLDKIRAGLAQPHSKFSDTCGMAMLRSTDAILSYKLSLMENHFWIRWNESIENWAGEEGGFHDRAGCLVFIVAIGIGAISTIGWLIA